MKGRRHIRCEAALCLLFSIAAVAAVLFAPFLVLRIGGTRIAGVPAVGEVPVEIRFIHSVQKTPVEEYLMGGAGGFTLHSTRYRSFGVGLPFLASDGVFREEGDAFVLDDMERHFPAVSLRVGVGTELTLTLGGRKYLLYQYPPGTRVDLVIERGWDTLK